MTIGQSAVTTKEPIEGPVTLISNTIEGGIRQLELSDLSVSAADLEKAILLNDALLTEGHVR